VANVIVIGAGMGGMACAARLASKGHSVKVLEHNETWGGKLGTAEYGEYKFDTGPSLLTLPAVYRDLFLKTGRALEDSIEIVDLETAFRYQFSDGTVLKMPGTGIGRCAEAIGDTLGGSSADDWRKFMRRAAQMWSVTRKPFLESELHGIKSLLALSWRLKDIRTIAPTKTLRELANQYLSDPRLITLVDRYATYTGSDPRQAPAALATVPYVEQMFGAYHVKGGLRELGRALYERAESIGVKFEFGCTVVNISTEPTISGVTLEDGRFISGEIVVANADASNVYEHLLSAAAQKRASAAKKSLAKATPSLSGFVILQAMTGKTPDFEHHNVFFPKDYDDEFNSIFAIGKEASAVADPTIYICSPNDINMTPAGNEAWFMLINAPRHDPENGIDWSNAELKEAYTKNVLARLSDRGLETNGRIQWQKSLSPEDLERNTLAPGGSIYGTSSNGMRSAFLRPENVTKIPNLYLVGGSSHPGGGLPLVGMSAEIVASHIGRA
jgi:phytoene desaturase